MLSTEYMHGVTLLDALALALFVCAWVGYTFWADDFSKQRPSLMTIMYHYRQKWMHESLYREPRIADASLLSTLIRSISLFASTAIFIIGGIVAMFGGLEQVRALTADLTYIGNASKVMWEIKLLTLALVFVYAFFKFAWSLRQFNYLLIVMGAFPAKEEAETQKAKTLADRAAQVNALAVQTFNRGMRAYYFGMATLGWFLHPWVFVGSTLLVVLVMYRREFKSRTLKALLQGSEFEEQMKAGS